MRTAQLLSVMTIKMKFKIQNSKLKIKTTSRRGVALLVVLFIVMAATVLSLAFLSSSDVELACGQNMTLRTEMDYLAESALEHARGLILNPQDIDGQYWAGAERQQLYAGQDYYDVDVNQLGPSNYQITSTAYRERAGRQVGRSSLQAELRLDPVIALWTGADTTINSGTTISGDVYCNGTLTNAGTINGDVFCNELIVEDVNEPLGQNKGPNDLLDLPFGWPGVTVDDFTLHYSVGSISGPTFGPYEPVRVCYSAGDLALAGNVIIDGMLLVEGDLTVTGTGNILRAGKNVPAVFVTGDMIIESGAALDVYGLAVVKKTVQISGGAGDINIVGGLFVEDALMETTADSSGNGNTGRLYNGPTWLSGALEFDGVDDYVQTSDDAARLQLNGDYTFGVWIRADAVQKNWAGIFSKCNPDGSINHWTLQFDDNVQKKLVVHHPVGFWDTGITLGNIASARHHIRIVRDGEWMTSYLDGNEIHSNTWNENPGSGDGHLSIGGERTSSADYVFKGLLDDVRIYNSAPLDANEPYPLDDDLVGHWELDEMGSGKVTITAAPPETSIFVWSQGDPQQKQKWGQAAGAFWRSIERK